MEYEEALQKRCAKFLRLSAILTALLDPRTIGNVPVGMQTTQEMDPFVKDYHQLCHIFAIPNSILEFMLRSHPRALIECWIQERNQESYPIRNTVVPQPFDLIELPRLFDNL